MKKAMFFCMWSFTFTCVSFAAEEVMLDKIVVTPSRTEGYMRDSSGAVTVIDSDVVEEASSKNIDEIIRDVPGVDVSRRTGLTSSTSTVTMRGFGGQARGRTLVLVDGVPFNEIYSGEVYWNAIPAEDVERIEVVPGPMATLYGPGAMGGVINIITKKPQALKTEVEAGYGTYNTYSANVMHQNKVSRLGYIVSGNYFKTDGYIAAVSPKSYDIKRDKENYSANLKFIYDFNENDSIGMGYRHYDEDVNGGRQYYYGSKELDDVNLNLKKSIKDINLSGALYFDLEDSSWTYDKSPSYTTIDYINKNPKRGLGGNLQAGFGLFDFNNVSIGTDWRWGKIDSVDDYKSAVRRVQAKGEQDSIGIYLQDELKLHEKFIVTAAGRWDYWQNYDGYLYDDTLSPKATYYDRRSDNEFTPRLGAVLHLTEFTNLRASAGKSFRTPTLYDLYRTWKSTTTTYQGNPDLTPEKAYCYEAGFDQTFWNKLLGRMTFYYNDVSDLIYSVGGTTKIKQNVGKVKIYGIETELRYDIIKELSIFANYTFNSSTIKKHTDASLEGKYLTYTPINKALFGCSFKNPKLVNAEATGRYNGSMYNNDTNTQKLKDYIVWELNFWRKITDNFEVSLKVENLQDTQYQEYLGLLAPGRTVTGSAKLRF